MSTAYDPSIPNPADAPASDVGTMQSNSGGIGNWCGQYDHFGLNNVANTGLHRQVTLPNANTPAGPPFTPVIFTFNDAFSVPQLRFYTGTAAQSANQYVASSFGSVLLLGGIILKWGAKFPNNATGSSIDINFSSAGVASFPNNCFMAMATSLNSSRTWNTVSVSTTDAVFGASSALGAGDNFYWFAIGN